MEVNCFWIYSPLLVALLTHSLTYAYKTATDFPRETLNSVPVSLCSVFRRKIRSKDDVMGLKFHFPARRRCFALSLRG